MKLDQLSIITAWNALGGPPLRRGRGQRFWLKSDGYSVALNTQRNTWYDFVAGEGGGAIGLVMVVLGCSKREALEFLEVHCGLDPLKPRTPDEQRAHNQKRATVALSSTLMADFFTGLRLALKPQVQIAAFLMNAGIEPREGMDFVAKFVGLLDTAEPEDLWLVACDVYREEPATFEKFVAIGAADRKDALEITRQITAMLAIAEERNPIFDPLREKR